MRCTTAQKKTRKYRDTVIRRHGRFSRATRTRRHIHKAQSGSAHPCGQSIEEWLNRQVTKITEEYSTRGTCAQPQNKQAFSFDTSYKAVHHA